MAKSINSDLIRGNINTIILKALFERDRYGYDIIKEIEIKSHGQYILKQPTLYSCLKRLESQGFVESYWGEPSANGVNRKYYRLTQDGREIFKQNQDEYEYSRTVIDSLISDSTYDLSSLEHQTSAIDENQEHIDSAQISERDNKDISVQDLSSQEIETNDTLDNKQIEQEETSQKQTEKEIQVEENGTNSEEKQDELEIFVKPDLESDQNIELSQEVIVEEEEKVETLLPPPSIFVSNTENQPKDVEQNENAEQIVENNENQQEEKVETQQKELTRSSVTDINTASIIDDMLYCGDNSYFDRQFTNQDMNSAENNDNQSVDEDEIAKKIAELEELYRQELLNADENQENIEVSQQSSSIENGENLEIDDESGFYKYNVAVENEPISEEERADARRRLFTTKQIISGQSRTVKVEPKPSSQTQTQIHKNLRIRNYGSMTAPIVDVGEKPEVRDHVDTRSEYKSQFYYRDSLLDLFKSGIMFLIILLELFAVYLIGKLGLNANTPYDTTIYIIAIVLNFSMPLVSAIRFIVNPQSVKRNDFNLKISMIYRIIITINFLLIAYAVNVYLKMPIGLDSAYFITLAVPAVFAINIPISALIFVALKNSGKFAVKN